MVGPFCMDAWLLHRGNWSSFVKMRQDFKIAICWKDVGNQNLLKKWSLNPSKSEILCAITFASVTWPPCCCTSLQTHISWLDRPCHLCKSQSRRDLNQFILPASSWHWTPLTSSSSYYLTTETPNINGGRPKGQFTIKSIHKAMSTNRLSTITLKLMKFSLLRVHHLSHSPLHFAEFTIHKGAPRPSPTGKVHRGTPGATSPHFYYTTLNTRCKLCPVGAY